MPSSHSSSSSALNTPTVPLRCAWKTTPTAKNPPAHWDGNPIIEPMNPPTTQYLDYEGVSWLNSVSQVLFNNINGYWINNTAPFGSGTRAQMLAKKDMIGGQLFYNEDDSKLCYYSCHTWQVSGETIEVTANQSLVEGNVVEFTNDMAVGKCRSTRDRDVVGVVAWGNASVNDTITVATYGIWPVLCKSGTYNTTKCLSVDAVDGIAEDCSISSSGNFARCVETKTLSSNGLVHALIHTIESA